MDGVGRIFGQGDEATLSSAANDRQRDSLFMAAQLRIGEAAATFEVRVRNLSAGGLMIEFERVLEPGTAVTLDMRGLGELTGTVAWSTRGRVGIALDEPIDPKRARKPVGAGRATPAYAKPAMTVRAPRRRG